MKVDPKQLNSLALAYLGDAIYEVYVRDHLIRAGNVKPNQLHRHAVRFVSGSAQAYIIHRFLADEILSQEEQAVARRGRNAKSQSVPKNTSLADYRYATAFEALIGYHYMSKNELRLETLMAKAIQIILEKEE